MLLNDADDMIKFMQVIKSWDEEDKEVIVTVVEGKRVPQQWSENDVTATYRFR